MYRASRHFLHTPSIRFTYALAKSCGSAGGAGATPTPSAAKSAPGHTILESFGELPKHLRPHVFEEIEIEVIHMGGAASYVPKHLQRKRK